MLDDVFFGSTEGGWVYPPFNTDLAWPITLGALLAVGAVACARVSRRLVNRRPVLVILAWLVLGTGAQCAIRSQALYPDRTLVAVESDPFHRTATTYPPARFLREFRGLVDQFQFHVRGNLAGKVLLYHALGTITDSPDGLLWLIIGCSNAGAVLAYAIAGRLFADRTAALAALILYLFLPSKLFFTPLPNVVSPTFILLTLWLLVRYLADRRAVWLVLLGAALYWSVLFDPLPLVTGLTFLALIGRAWRAGTIGPRHLLAVLVLPTVSFFAVDGIVYWKFEYEIVSALRFAAEEAADFHRYTPRPYGLWVGQNLLDTFWGTGLLTSAVLLAVGLRGLGRAALGGRSLRAAVLRSPDVYLAVSVLASLAVVDVAGMNRGETQRLWIFWGAFAQLAVAGTCARRPVLFAAVVATSLLQASVGVGTRIFVAPC